MGSDDSCCDCDCNCCSCDCCSCDCCSCDCCKCDCDCNCDCCDGDSGGGSSGGGGSGPSGIDMEIDLSFSVGSFSGGSDDNDEAEEEDEEDDDDDDSSSSSSASTASGGIMFLPVLHVPLRSEPLLKPFQTVPSDNGIPLKRDENLGTNYTFNRYDYVGNVMVPITILDAHSKSLSFDFNLLEVSAQKGTCVLISWGKKGSDHRFGVGVRFDEKSKPGEGELVFLQGSKKARSKIKVQMNKWYRVAVTYCPEKQKVVFYQHLEPDRVLQPKEKWQKVLKKTCSKKVGLIHTRPGIVKIGSHESKCDFVGWIRDVFIFDQTLNMQSNIHRFYLLDPVAASNHYISEMKRLEESNRK